MMARSEYVAANIIIASESARDESCDETFLENRKKIVASAIGTWKWQNYKSGIELQVTWYEICRYTV